MFQIYVTLATKLSNRWIYIKTSFLFQSELSPFSKVVYEQFLLGLNIQHLYPIYCNGNLNFPLDYDVAFIDLLSSPLQSIYILCIFIIMICCHDIWEAKMHT